MEVELTGRFVYDERLDAKRPGMLVVHDGAGLDDHAVEQATRLAELGLVAFACDMYGHEVAGDRERTVAAVTTLRDDPVMMVRRAAAALEMLASHPEVNRRLGVIGYCFGGLIALQLARSGTAISAAIGVHGSLATSSPAKPGEINARILACHGPLDPFVPPAQVLEFVEEMN